MKTTLFALAIVAASFAAVGQSAPAAPVVPTSATATDSYTTLMAATIQELMSTGDAAKLKLVDAELGRAAAEWPFEKLRNGGRQLVLSGLASVGPASVSFCLLYLPV